MASSFQLDRQELKDLILITLVLGFGFSFRTWGVDSFDFAIGFSNFILILLLTGVSVFIHEIVHRYVGDRHGAHVKIKTWYSLLFISLVITVLTNGLFVFTAVWTMALIAQFHRVGHAPEIMSKAPSHLGPWERAWIGVSGPLMNFGLGIFAAIMLSFGESFFWYNLMIINLWIAVLNLFPFFRVLPALIMGSTRFIHNLSYRIGKLTKIKDELPYMEGEIVFFGWKAMWALFFTWTLVTSVLLILTAKIGLSLVMGGLIGVAMWIIAEYYIEPWGLVEIRKRKKQSSTESERY